MSLWSYLETNPRLVIYERSGFIILATGVDVFEWDTLGERSSLERNVQMWGNHFELKKWANPVSSIFNVNDFHKSMINQLIYQKEHGW